VFAYVGLPHNLEDLKQVLRETMAQAEARVFNAPVDPRLVHGYQAPPQRE